MDAQVYILISLVVAFFLFVILFVWIRMMSVTLTEIQLTINKVEGILWKMNRLLSAQGVVDKRLPDDGQTLRLSQKPRE